MLLGISSFTYGWRVGVRDQVPSEPLTEVDLLSIAKRHGLKCIQLGDNLPLHKFDEDRKNSFKRQIEREGIRLELGARGLTPVHLASYIELAREFDSPLLRFVIDEGMYAPAIVEVADIIKDFIPVLSREDIILGIENHDRFRAHELVGLMEHLDSPHVGICLDTVNSIGAGEGLEHVTKLLAPFTVNLHIKDFSVQRAIHSMGFTITGAPAGKGMMDIPALLQSLHAFQRCRSAVLEQWVPFQGNLDDTIELEERWAEESLAYLQSISLIEFNKSSLTR